MISWAAILSSTKLAHLVKVGAEAEVAGRAAEVGAVVMAEEVVVAVAEVAAVAVAGVAAVVDEIAVIVAAEAEATVAGNRLPTIKICNVTGELAEAGSPVLFSAILFVVKIPVLFYAFPREFLWLHYMSKTSPKNSMKRCVAARAPGAARSPRRSLPCWKKTSPRLKN